MFCTESMGTVSRLPYPCNDTWERGSEGGKIDDEECQYSLTFARQKLLLPDICLLENGKKRAHSKLPMAWHGHEPLFLIVPEVNMADGLLYRVIAEQEEGPDYIMR